MNCPVEKSPWHVGVARRVITPGNNVELAGLGYYLNRTPTSVRDNLNATALIIEDRKGDTVALIALDLMYADEQFTKDIRRRLARSINISPEAICINCSHSHNAPVAAVIRGVGEMNPEYAAFVAESAAEVTIEAWRKRRPARLQVATGEASGFAFNRTREDGPVDTRLQLLYSEALDGDPIAIAINYHCHLNAHLEVDLRTVSRDWSGEVVDFLEAALPGVTALYLQGTCGDVMVSSEFSSTVKRSEPAREVARVALESFKNARPVAGDVGFITETVQLPTRRWTLDEINRDRTEALHRLKTGDTKDWLNGLARVIVTYPDRLPQRYGGSVEKAVAAVSRFGVEWTDAILPILNTRPEYIETEVQAMRIGDVWLVAHSSELYTTLGLELRRQWPHSDLFMLGYSNGIIGYLPDAHDVVRQSYAANQSPKFTGQFPFTTDSGEVLIKGLLKALNSVADSQVSKV